MTVLWGPDVVKWKYLLPYQEISQPSAISGLQMWMRSPKTVIQKMPPSPRVMRSWEDARNKVNKGIGLAPDRWGAYERNEFSEPQGLHLPIHWMLNSLTWYLIFVVQTACSLCCKLAYSLASSQASMEQFSQRHWEAVSWALSPKHSYQKKKNYFQVVTIFFGSVLTQVLQDCCHYYCKSWSPHVTMWLETYLNEVVKELLKP